MPAIATECLFFFNILFHYKLPPQQVKVPMGHPQVEHNINHLSMLPSIAQQIRCLVIVWTCGANYSTLIFQFLQFELKLKLKLNLQYQDIILFLPC
jgi:hypothetical protein